MQINFNINSTSIMKVTTLMAAPGRPKAESETEFSAAAALASALQQTPAVRSSEIARASKLVEDPSYPPAALLKALAGVLVRDFEELE